MLKKVCIGLMVITLIVGAYSFANFGLVALDSLARIEDAPNYTVWATQMIRQVKSPFMTFAMCIGIEDCIRFVMRNLED